MGVFILSITDADDWLFVHQPMLLQENWGLITAAAGAVLGPDWEDWGQSSAGVEGALQLGPLRRQLDRQKFNKQGGFSKDTDNNTGEHLGGGYRLEHFKDEMIARYITTQNEKTRIVMNSHITKV